MNAKRHKLFDGYLNDSPGRNESWTEYVEYLGEGSWRFTLEGTDFSGSGPGGKSTERMSTKRLLDWVSQKDAEAAEEGAPGASSSNDSHPTPGPRARRLLSIAKSVGADYCVRQLRKSLRSG